MGSSEKPFLTRRRLGGALSAMREPFSSLGEEDFGQQE